MLHRRVCVAALRRSAGALSASWRGLSTSRLSQYEQEAYEAHQRLQASTTYPGAIRAATPGDTTHYIRGVTTILPTNERHYWRAVVDDPLVEHTVSLRVRFKTHVWVTSGWEVRMQAVHVVVPRDATLQRVIEQVQVENTSPYLCTSPFTLSIDGVELDSERTLSDYSIDEHTRLDAVVHDDHEAHHDSVRPKDWNVDELTAGDLAVSPYKEMGMTPTPTLAPRYEARPPGYFGTNNYSGMRRTS